VHTYRESYGNDRSSIYFKIMLENRSEMKKPKIRPLLEIDIPKIIARYSFPWSTPEATRILWHKYHQEQQNGIRTVAVLEENNEILGYGSLLRHSEYPSFAKQNIPEINAIWIDANQRKHGLGTSLVKWLEDLALQEGYKRIGIGVGLYPDYGPAQRLYFKLGYRPDGNGVSYKAQPTTAGQSYPLDDDFILWLTKELVN
jgi:GNAT superfamily N-acetyltransferase